MRCRELWKLDNELRLVEERKHFKLQQIELILAARGDRKETAGDREG